MSLALQGIHHVTAITGDAPGNLDFYTRVLGLRLVKKTVNQDDVSAYHLFYGDQIGSPGTEVTFFDWPRAAPRRSGAGTIAAFALRVPDENALNLVGQTLRSRKHNAPQRNAQRTRDSRFRRCRKPTIIARRCAPTGKRSL